MKFACIKYSGLKFTFSFETKDFIFIPLSSLDKMGIIAPIDFLNFFYIHLDEDSEFYVINKKPLENNDLTVDNFSEELLYSFKYLEALFGILFSNLPLRKYVFILEKKKSSCRIDKVFKKIPEKIALNKKCLIWKNQIFVEPLIEMINDSFKTLRKILKNSNTKSLEKVKDFATRYYFCVDMYLRGKFGESSLRKSTDLWISLEVLSVIVISNILYFHEKFEVKGFFKDLKSIVKKTSSLINKDAINCWEPLKQDFPDHIKNKINNFLPINQKVKKFAKRYLKNEDFKVPVKQESDFSNKSEYLKYLDNTSEFRTYQDKISISSIIGDYYSIRNSLFHGGGINENWSLKIDRNESNFIKIIEQLLFKVLNIKNVVFHQFGYKHQRVYIKVNGICIDENIFNCYDSVNNHFKEKYMDSGDPSLSSDLNKLKTYYSSKKKYTESLKNLLVKCEKIIEVFIEKVHFVKIESEGEEFIYCLKLEDIKEKILPFRLNYGTANFSGINDFIEDLKWVNITTDDNKKIIGKIKGVFTDLPETYTGKGYQCPLLIYPPYILFKF